MKPIEEVERLMENLLLFLSISKATLPIEKGRLDPSACEISPCSSIRQITVSISELLDGKLILEY
jgi:hypothetical protein